MHRTDGARFWKQTNRYQLRVATSRRACRVRIAAKFDRRNSAKESQIRSSPTDICQTTIKRRKKDQKKMRKRNLDELMSIKETNEEHIFVKQTKFKFKFWIETINSSNNLKYQIINSKSWYDITSTEITWIYIVEFFLLRWHRWIRYILMIHSNLKLQSNSTRMYLFFYGTNWWLSNDKFLKSILRCGFSLGLAFDDERLIIIVLALHYLKKNFVWRRLLHNPRRRWHCRRQQSPFNIE